MKIFSGKQIYEADKFTIEKQEISSFALMERAAEQLFQWLHQRMQGAQVKIHIFSGIGNNGGDGIALARHLWEHGYNFDTYVVNYSEKRSKDFLLNLDRLKERKIWPNFLNKGAELPEIHPDDIIIDAIFGIGLNRPPDPWVGEIINYLNTRGTFILSVDVPSGLYLDRAVEKPEYVIRSNFVLSFQAPKLVFFLPETGPYIREWDVLDIGLDPEFLQTTPVDYHFMTKVDLLPWFRPRQRFAHKGHYGHARIIGGSYGKIGAVALAGEACLRIGSGLVSCYVPKCGYLPLQSMLPEIMVETDTNEKEITSVTANSNTNVAGIGMGLGTSKKSEEALGKFLKAYSGPLVVDADAINILAQNPAWLKELPPDTILTPHPGELRRLLGEWKNDFDKLDKARAFVEQYNCILVIKGAHTLVVYQGQGFINSTGNPGMATAGSGDVLTGIITGMLAQGYPPFQAAVFGIYLHGAAGDMAATKRGLEAMIATDITDELGEAYKSLFAPPPMPEVEGQEEELQED